MLYQTISLKQFFPVNGVIYNVAIATVIFSYVWRYHVFVQKFTWYFIGVYIIKTINKFIALYIKSIQKGCSDILTNHALLHEDAFSS